MVTASSSNLFILFWQASQKLSRRFIKRNLANWSFHLIKYGNLTKTVCILSRYTPVRRNLSKVKSDKTQMIKRQFKDLSIQNGNCMQIPYALLFQITCLQTLSSRKMYPGFSSLHTNITPLNSW